MFLNQGMNWNIAKLVLLVIIDKIDLRWGNFPLSHILKPVDAKRY